MTLGVLNTHKYIIFINHKYLSNMSSDIYDMKQVSRLKISPDFVSLWAPKQFRGLFWASWRLKMTYLYYDG